MKGIVFTGLVLLLVSVMCIGFPGESCCETKSAICSCWLTAYDHGIKGKTEESAEYRSGYIWCRKNGSESGRAWKKGWLAGRRTAAGETSIPRNCNHYFRNSQ